jgi:hypothetical protein
VRRYSSGSLTAGSSCATIPQMQGAQENAVPLTALAALTSEAEPGRHPVTAWTRGA